MTEPNGLPVEAFLEKPVNPQVLIETVARLLEKL
jgi:hypothetical protein